jgi:hypothetical protein
MKISTLRKIAIEDLQKAGGEIPPWVETLISPINELMDQFATGMRSGLSVRQNFLASILDVKLTHNVELKLNTQKSGIVLGVIPLSAVGENAQVETITSFGYRVLGANQIQVKATFGSGSGTRQTKLLVFFDEV